MYILIDMASGVLERTRFFYLPVLGFDPDPGCSQKGHFEKSKTSDF
jgi:hypothetical protein